MTYVGDLCKNGLVAGPLLSSFIVYNANELRLCVCVSSAWVLKTKTKDIT